MGGKNLSARLHAIVLFAIPKLILIMLLLFVRLVNFNEIIFFSSKLCLQTSLLSVESLPEHLFIKNWLNERDPSTQRWITSGRRSGPFWQWAKSTGLINFQFDQGWLPRTEQEQRIRSFLVYAYQSTLSFSLLFPSCLSSLTQVVNGVGYHMISHRRKIYHLFVKFQFEKLMV